MMGAVTMLLPFTGWLITDRGTVIRAGSLPWGTGRTREELWGAQKRNCTTTLAALWESWEQKPAAALLMKSVLQFRLLKIHLPLIHYTAT